MGEQGQGRPVATKWQEKATSSLKTAKWPNGIHWCLQLSYKAAKFMSKLISQSVVNYSRQSACQGDMESFEGNPSTSECLTSLRNKSQEKQPGKFSASTPNWIVRMCTAIIWRRKVYLAVCMWKATFLRSSHMQIIYANHVTYKLHYAWRGLYSCPDLTQKCPRFEGCLSQIQSKFITHTVKI